MIPSRTLAPLLLAAALAATSASAAPLAIGEIVVTDPFSFPTAAVLRIDPVSGTQTKITQGGLLVNPTGVAVDDTGIVYVIDAIGVIVRVDPAAYDAGNPGANQELVAQNAMLEAPQDGAFDADGTLLVAVQSGAKLVRVDPSAFDVLHPEANQTLVTSGNLLGSPKDVAIDRATGVAYVTSFNFDRVVRVAPNGDQSLVASGPQLNSPLGIAREADGHLIVRGYPNNMLVRVDPDAYSDSDPSANLTVVSAGGLLVLISDVAIEASGDIVATDGVLNHVTRVDPDAYDDAHPDANQTLVSPQGDLVSPLAIAVFTPEPAEELLALVAVAALVGLYRSRAHFTA